MIKGIQKITNFGISSTSDPKERGKIKTLNMVCLITLVLNISLIYPIFKFTGSFIYPLVGIILSLLYFTLLHFKLYTISVYYFSLASNVLIFLLANAYGREAGIQLMSLMSAVFSLVLYPGKRKIVRFIFFMVPILIFILLELFDYSILPTLSLGLLTRFVYYLILGTLMIFLYIIFATYQVSNEKSELMITTKEQIFKQVILKEKMNKQKLLESIHYARTIELSILPRKEDLEKVMADYFVIWKPKDIVGGDFYWLYPGKDYFLLAVIDCTGHGVPGALMTMTVYTLLERIVEKYTKTKPSEIISYLNIHLHNTLNVENGDDYADYGVDIGVCYCNKKEGTLIFSGARNSLLYSSKGNVIQVHGDTQSVGYKDSREDYVYTDHTINFTGDEVFYLLSDGFVDQIGGSNLFPFGKKRLTSCISENYSKTMYEQQLIYDNELKMYQRGNEQLDDITLIGFRL